MWEKLQTIYEGDEKVKRAKLQVYKGQFESLKMNEEENIAAYILHVDEVFKSIK
jgi:hypothetical protein